MMRRKALWPFLVVVLASGACHRGGSSGAADGGTKPTLDTSAGERAPAGGAAKSASAPSALAGPDVVANASPAWTDGPAVTTDLAVDGAALRAKVRARLQNDASPVTLLHGGTPEQLGRRLCERVVPPQAPGTPVLLRPNLGGFDSLRDPATHGGDDGITGRTTDVQFTRGVVRCLKARGLTRITIADGWGGPHAGWERLVRVSGYQQMADEEHVPLVAMNDDGVFDKEGDKPGLPVRVTGMENTHVPTLLIPKVLADHLDHGLVIAIPKIKTHRFSVVSLAIKGMQGSVMLSNASPAYKQKARMHHELNGAKTREAFIDALDRFAERIVDVLEIEAPHVVLAEGCPAMGGNGFSKLIPVGEPIAIGGTHVVRVDKVGSEWLGLWDSDDLARELAGRRASPLILLAAKRFATDLAHVTVTGDGASLLRTARPVHFDSLNGYSIHRSATGEAMAHPDAMGSDASVEAGADATHDVGDGSTSSLPELRAPQAPRPPTLDGRGTDPIWSKAEPAEWTTDYSGRATGTRTRVRALWDTSALYFQWELEGAGLMTDQSRPVTAKRLKLYEEDCVELFLAPDRENREVYGEVEVGPYGHFFDLKIDRQKHASDTDWSAALHIATSRDVATKHAIIEFSTAAPEFVAALRAGARLPMGLFRMEGKAPRAYLAWSPPRTEKPNFHVPSAFGTLHLLP